MPEGSDKVWLHLEIAQDAMELALRAEPGAPAEALTEEAIRALLAEHQVPESPEIQARISEAAERWLSTPGRPPRVVLLRGTPPVPGEDGRVRFEPGLDPESEPAAGPGDARVCHYSRSAHRPVSAGQVIATIVPPTEGEPGRDVKGNEIPPKPGTPSPIKTDNSVTVSESGQVVAAVDGVLDYRPPHLGVREELQIPEYVDFSTGNVRFPGDVLVQKGVRDRFEVCVGGVLTVNGLVEAASLESETDVVLAGGMAGRERGAIRAERDLVAKHLNSAYCVVGRDLVVERELTNCRVAVGRRFLGERCTVTGGVLMVARECTAAQVGGGSGAATALILGRIAGAEALIAQAAELLPDLRKRVSRAEKRLEQSAGAAVVADPPAQGRRAGRSGRPDAARQGRLEQLQCELADARARLGAVTDRIERLRRLGRSRTKVQLTVHKMLNPGVTIWFGPYSARFGDGLKGPFRIEVVPGEGGAEARLVDLLHSRSAPLSDFARVVRHESFTGPLPASWGMDDPEEVRAAA